MWNEPSNEQLAKIPRLYETEKIPLKEKLVYLHFFIGGCDWYVVEFDGTEIFRGYAILGGDYANAEWGYISFGELKSINIRGIEIDCDLNWTICKASDIEKMRIGNQWEE